MSCTPEERLEIERACNERLMRSLTTGDFQIHGLKWDTIIGAIQHMDELAPRKTWEGQLEQLKQRMALEARVAELEVALREIDTAVFPSDCNHDYIQYIVQDALKGKEAE